MTTVAFELKARGVRPWLGLVVFAMRNWIFTWTFFLPSFVLSLAQMFTGAAAFYLMGTLVGPGAAEHVQRYGVGYGSYIITGLMLNLLMTETLQGYHQCLSSTYWASQTDAYLQHPGGLSALLVGNLLMRYLMAAVNTLAYLLVGVWLFRVPVAFANLPHVAGLLGLALFSLTGLGLAGASAFTLLNAKSWDSNPVTWLMGFAVTLMAGVYFPPTVLPEWLQAVGGWLPQTHALHAARLCLSGQATLATPEVGASAGFLVKFGLATLPVGLVLYGAGMRRAQRDGTLSRWS